MQKQKVVAVFDVGKTNKKLFLFNERYEVVWERSAKFTETVDEDGDPCENLDSLRLSVFDSLREVFRSSEFEVRAINFATYGASFVYLDKEGRPLTPLYNYLKAYPEAFSDAFYTQYGGADRIAKETASPTLGSLNSGMQLYRLKKQQPAVYAQTHCALHLPQYLSFLISGREVSDLTSLGCHTQLWDFSRNQYHNWVVQEGIDKKLAPVAAADTTFPSAFPGTGYQVGIGLHDSSAALIPYLVSFRKPFVLLSTGTWCISLNPFNDQALTSAELKKDCLCYLHYQGKPVKASRLFAGYEHEMQIKRIGDFFKFPVAKFKAIPYHYDIIKKIKNMNREEPENGQVQKLKRFSERELSMFSDPAEAYHQLLLDLIAAQVESTTYVLQDTGVKRIFVDGGFGKNSIYMNLLADAFPDLEVYSASMPQATAIGAALAIHSSWNEQDFPNDVVELKYYASGKGRGI